MFGLFLSGTRMACVCGLSLFSRVGLPATPWSAAHQAPLSIGFSRQEYLSGLPFPSLGDLPNPGIKPGSPALQADFFSFEPPGKPSGRAIVMQTSLLPLTEEQPTRGDQKGLGILTSSFPPLVSCQGSPRAVTDKKTKGRGCKICRGLQSLKRERSEERR